MPRKGHIAKREVAPDPVYGSTLVTKFVNSMMWGGKKSTAQGIFYKAMKSLEEKGGGDDALKLFKKAVENCKPLLEVKTRRVGGANYQVPIEVNPDRRTSLAHHLWPQPRRKGHDREAGQRAAGCGQRARRGDEEEGRRAPHGRGQQGLCPLPLVGALRA
jgi:ribosomal protein S7